MITETFPIIIGGEEVTSERLLTKSTEPGLMMNGPESVRFIVVHCSATRSDRDYTVAQLLRDHKARGFRTVGYHFYIRRDGTITQHRRLLEVGAHCRPYNRCSIGVCYEGGIDTAGHPADTRTALQRNALLMLLGKLRRLFPEAVICGHCDMRGAVPKACPCFDARTEYMYL
ncbi:MAG: N-acetylmuramoyl-L-alanine amidase [Prevotella sp.]